MTRRAIVLTILAAVVVLGLVRLVLPIVQDALHTGDGAVIRAEVRLINQCPLANSSFAVRNTNTGRSMRIPEYPATHSDNIRPPVPGYPATCDALP
jgi:hypothetical protein